MTSMLKLMVAIALWLLLFWVFSGNDEVSDEEEFDDCEEGTLP